MGETLLELKNLYSERNDRLLFSDLNLRVAGGEILQVLGSNGCGKTSLLRIMAGLSSRFEGEMYWRGYDMASQRSVRAAELLYVGHGVGLKRALSPRENLRWSSALQGEQASTTDIQRALIKTGLAGLEDVPCMHLSAGQQRRANLARLFCGSAALWILDEPFTAIDQHGVAEIERWILAFSERGGAVILTSHQPLGPSLHHRSLALGGAA